MTVMDIQQTSSQSVGQGTHTPAQPSSGGQSVNVASSPQVSQVKVNSGANQTKTKQNSNQTADEQLTRNTDSVAERVLLDAIEKANSKVNGANAEYSFSVHKATKQIMIKVTDKNSGEVIKEIPSKKALDAVAMMWEFAGLMVDEKR